MISKICSLKSQLIKFPDADELPRVEMKFRHMKGFPGVIGCVDGTHIPIKVLHSDIRETFRCRKGFFSLNAQMICGPDCRIYDLVASWPGSAHDSNVFNRSVIRRRFLNGEFGDYHLLADSAYRLTKSVMTPYKNEDSVDKSSF